MVKNNSRRVQIFPKRTQTGEKNDKVNLWYERI